MHASDATPTQTFSQQPGGATGDYRPDSSASLLVGLLDQYLADLQAGKSPDRARLLAQHPGLAAELEQCLAGIEFVHRAGEPAGAAPARLGDFRIVREIGRGGMGVVYEAEQVSLKRRVAVKVLRFGAVPEPVVLQRFQREAETVARLHHTNIVPVFCVDCHEGVHYYAMQFIEGQSLADVLAQARKTGEPIEPRAIARWGLQAAEALAYAHQRGVIHRDIKPSNLLLDGEGTAWLTDFGLAKRADEVTLTLAGAVMGTPRYMSPEQAAGVKQPVDHRTDVYSLGATLYELATGRPVFDADTPHGVLTQILTAEPVPPRQVQRSLPRDLETIILKCLSKEPGRRYASAEALAYDLRAFLEGRSIRARRASLAERATRWVRQRRQGVTAGGVAAAATLLLAVGAVLGRVWYVEAHQGEFFIDCEDAHATAEVLAADRDVAVVPAFTLPTQQPVVLPEGNYRLRVLAHDRLSETYQFVVTRGKRQRFQFRLERQLLGEPLNVPRFAAAVDFGGRSDLVVVSGTGLRRVEAAGGKEVWSLDLARQVPDLKWEWIDPRMLEHTWSGRGECDRRPYLVERTADLDGDGVPDLVWAGRHDAFLLAVSGKTGKVLWSYRPAPSDGEDRNRSTNSYPPAERTVLGATLLDVDGDGVLDVVATFAAPAPQGANGWAEAVSGRTGKRLWRHALFEARQGGFNGLLGKITNVVGQISDAGAAGRKPGQWRYPGRPSQLTTLDPDAVPAFGRWYPGMPLAGGFDQGGSLGMRYVVSGDQSFGEATGAARLYDRGWEHRSWTWLPVPSAPQITRSDGQAVVVVVAGTLVLGLDARTGAAAWAPFDCGFWPALAPVVADLTGDGRPDVVLVRQDADDQLTVVAVAPAAGKTLWQAGIQAIAHTYWYEPPLGWPLVADLGGDGKPAVIVPAGGFDASSKWAGLRVLDGATGAPRWERRLNTVPSYLALPPVDRFILGPDVDADGHREVFVATMAADRMEYREGAVLYVDALSGKDGHTVWSWNQPHPKALLLAAPAPTVGALAWWSSGANGTSRLVVPYVPNNLGGEFKWGYSTLDLSNRRERFETYVLSGDDGRLLHVGQDVREPVLADLDGDGVPDLWSFHPRLPTALDGGGRVHVLRGRPTARWQELGESAVAAGDYDGDGSADVVRASGGNLTALSGHDGHVLWRTSGVIGNQFATFPSPVGDLDGDGVPDLLTFPGGVMGSFQDFSVLQAVSGKTGKRLWTADIRVRNYNGMPYLGCHDLDGDGRPEVVVVGNMDWGPQIGGASSNSGHFWLAVVSGADGTVRWKQQLCAPLTFGGSSVYPHGPRPAIADVDRDGVRDVIVPALTSATTGELRAFSGRDGTLLWSRPFVPQPDARALLVTLPVPVVADLTEDGAAVVLVLEHTDRALADQPRQKRTELHLLDAHTGRSRATWLGPEELPELEWGSGYAQPISLPAPVVTTLAGGRRLICISNTRAGRLFLIDAAGREVGSRPIQAPGRAFIAVHAHDLDGLAGDELVFAERGKVTATTGGLERVLWQWAMPSNLGEILDVQPGRGAEPATVVVRSGNAVYGLAGPTGAVRWRVEGPGLVAGFLPGDVPAVLYHAIGPATVCVSVGASGGSDALRPATESDHLRHLRPLPWTRDVFLRDRFSHVGLLATAVFVPFAVFWAVRPRARRAGFMAARALGFGLAIITIALAVDARTSDPGDTYAWKGWYFPLLIGVAGELGVQALAWSGRGLRLVVRRLRLLAARARAA